jgi:hypothetical protein
MNGGARSGESMSMRIAALVIATLLVVAPSHAHHSGAIFDHDHMITLTGKVREFQWTNPHCFIQVVIAGASGEEEWSVEMGAPLQLYQAGWKPATLKPGDDVTVVVHPARDGTHGGLFLSATGRGGAALGRKQ